LSTTFIEALICLGVALVAGFLVGAERERAMHTGFAGARTFPLFALAGAVSALLGTWVLVAMALSVGAMLATAYFRKSSGRDDLGMSTEVSAAVTFVLGALCTASIPGLDLSERLLLAVGGATATTALLSIKKPLHGFIARLSYDEVYATIKLLLLAVILLPLLPDQDMGVGGTLNPFAIGVLVVLIAGIGFVGYVAIRLLGVRRGLGVTGLAGGLASSTAVTLNFAGRAGSNREDAPACTVAIVLASAVMFPRILLEVYAVSPALTWQAFWPFTGAAAAAFLMGAVMYRRIPRERSKEEGTTEMALDNPFSLWSALKFAALFVLILFVSGTAVHHFQDAGVYVSAAVAGLADADSVALTAARLYRSAAVQREVAANAVGLACVMNTVSKVGIAAVLGGPRLGGRVGAVMGTALVVGAAIHFLLL
jgi:uncharacterized membrane protein (DUF4010 family)